MQGRQARRYPPAMIEWRATRKTASMAIDVATVVCCSSFHAQCISLIRRMASSSRSQLSRQPLHTRPGIWRHRSALAISARDGRSPSQWFASHAIALLFLMQPQSNNEPYNFLSEEPVLDWIAKFETPAEVAEAYKKLVSGALSRPCTAALTDIAAESGELLPGSTTLATDLPTRRESAPTGMKTAAAEVDMRQLLPKRLSKTDIVVGAGSIEEQIDSMFGDALHDTLDVGRSCSSPGAHQLARSTIPRPRRSLPTSAAARSHHRHHHHRVSDISVSFGCT